MSFDPCRSVQRLTYLSAMLAKPKFDLIYALWRADAERRACLRGHDLRVSDAGCTRTTRIRGRWRFWAIRFFAIEGTGNGGQSPGRRRRLDACIHGVTRAGQIFENTPCFGQTARHFAYP